MKKTWLLALITVGFLVSIAVQLLAEEGRIHLKKMKVVPSIKVRAGYDDNIYLGSGDNNTTEREVSDWLWQFEPAVMLDYLIPGRGYIQLGYGGIFTYYGQNEVNNWQGQQAFLRVNYDAPGGLIFALENVFNDTEDPYGSENEFKLGVPQVDRWTNDLRSKVGFAFSNRLKVLGFVNYYKQSYEDTFDFSQDYRAHELGLGTEFQVAPQTWGFVRYHYGERDYYTHPAFSGVTDDNDSDYEWHRVNAGVLWHTTAKITGELNLGYQWKDYDNNLDVTGASYEDKDTWIASTFLSYKASPTTTLSLSLTRALREEGSDSNVYYEDTGFGLNLAKVFLTKYTLNLGGLYNTQEYNEPNLKEREDDKYKFEFALEYQIRQWMLASVGYLYQKRDSNFSENEYTDNQLWLSLHMSY